METEALDGTYTYAASTPYVCIPPYFVAQGT